MMGFYVLVCVFLLLLIYIVTSVSGLVFCSKRIQRSASNIRPITTRIFGKVFEAQECVAALRSVKGNKVRLESVLKDKWRTYGLQSLQVTKKAVVACGDSDLSEVVSDLVDNLSRRNEQTSTKLLGSLAKEYMISLPPEVKGKSGLGRSEVLDVFCLADGLTYKGKIVREKIRYERELAAFGRVSGVDANKIACESGGGGKQQQRSKRYDSLVAIVDGGQQVLILERGIGNLRSLRDQAGPLDGKQLRSAMRAMADSVAKVHTKGLVWCDIKLENFVMVPKDASKLYPVDSSVKYDKLLQSCSVKAIDLESVTTKGTEMTDFAPETVAPELVAQLTGGAIGTVGSRDKDIRINPQSAVLASQASDVFSLGLCYVELASRTEVGSVLGTAVGKSFARVNRYVDGNDDLGLSGIPDTRVKQLLAKMLEVDPSKRPSMLEVQLRLKLL